MERIKLFLIIFLISYIGVVSSMELPLFSTAGFYEIPNSGRKVFNMNMAWRFYKGDIDNAYIESFDDSEWNIVSLPDGIELLPEEASGDINYQGIVWYRKHFRLDGFELNKKIFLHFEGIMGKSKIWINGRFVKENYGGYLPVVIDVTDYVYKDNENIIAVCADNSNDKSYAPGRPQYALDFTYFGGIYRDCWLITHDNLYITDPNLEDEVGGGGLFVRYYDVSNKKATISLQLHLRNDSQETNSGSVDFSLTDLSGKQITECLKKYSIKSNRTEYVLADMKVDNPCLWSPESPYLYWLTVEVKDKNGNVIDGYRQRLGIRSLEMKGKEGFWLNGKPYDKLIGANRHQDFAVLGNALPNSLHWRDAFKLRNAGMKIIRSAHYPQDPAFLDACDELGLFIIDATPGWQFYNKDSVFSERVYDNIRNMVRRDRNRPSLLFYEPILNETIYPEDFALNAKKCVDEEMKGYNAYSASDYSKNGRNERQYGIKYYPVIYSHPSIEREKDKVYFTREFGDNVDDWSAHNSTSRVCRAWGEVPMLIQAEHYAYPKYSATCIESLYRTPPSHIGGALWHSFDHQRGCSPISFYGGIMDSYRQPKTSYYMFMSQRPNYTNDNLKIETGPMVYIANEMTPFSPSDVTVYSNCEEVRLTIFENGKQLIWKRDESSLKMPSPIITFNDAFDFMETKKLSRAGRQKEVYLLAEGLINGKVVATHKRIPSRKSYEIRIRLDNNGMPVVADGSDVVVAIAEVVDNEGTVKRLNNNIIHFSIEGEGEILGDYSLGLNPVRANWGSAPILIRTTSKPGKIRIKASICGEGVNSIKSGELVFETTVSPQKYIYDTWTVKRKSESVAVMCGKKKIIKEINVQKDLENMEQQQELFGE
ncbi:sugar-binding domain-containing protein [uncultured Bacteroides sp.]|uniref:sugar-binding domain-containing protein n=1 Tax=uncultured Bacteroides sp. TaxID=162156 RepID=UPI0026038BAB|nr:sugar-binding domain-containing protein [uncultured Bacteroides sp.]